MRPGATLLLLGLLASLSLAASLFATELASVRHLLVGASGVGTILAAYVQYYRPLTKVAEQRREALLRFMLPAFVRDYRLKNPHVTHLRVNVALVHRRPLSAPYLKIRYTSGQYPQQELELRYSPGVGCWGLALETRDQVWYDSKLAPRAADKMSVAVFRVTQQLGSILSTPIFSDTDAERARPLAVLSLDSTDSVDATGFNLQENLDKAAEFATLIGRIL
jgi:hypothetical protein